MTSYFTDPMGQTIVSSFQNLGLALNSIESNNSEFVKFDVQAILDESFKQCSSSGHHAIRTTKASEKHDMSIMVSDDSDEDNNAVNEDGSFYSTNESFPTGKNHPKIMMKPNDTNHHLKQKSIYDDCNDSERHQHDNGRHNNNNNNNDNQPEDFDALIMMKRLGLNTSKQLVEDEWADDDDNGYVVITISTEEFFEMEEACAGRMAYEEELKQETDTWLTHATANATANTTSSSSSSSSIQQLSNTVLSLSFGMTPRDCDTSSSNSSRISSSGNNNSNNNTDIQGASNEFNNQYYAGMYEDLQSAKAAALSNNDDNNTDKKRNMEKDSNDDDDMHGTHVTKASELINSTINATTTTNGDDDDLDDEQRIDLALQSQQLSSRKQQHVFNTSSMLSSGKDSAAVISSSGSKNSNNNSNNDTKSTSSSGSSNSNYSNIPTSNKNIDDNINATNSNSNNNTSVHETTGISHSNSSSDKAVSKLTRRLSQGEIRRSEIMGQNRFQGADNKSHSYFNLKVIFEPNKTGFEEQKHFAPNKGTIIAGRYEVSDVLGTAAFSTALQCADLIAEENEPKWVCLKVIKNNKDFFDQSMDEIKLLQYINSHCEPDDKHILRLIDFFYYKEHLFIVSELLRENLYEFGRYVREEKLEPYYTLPRLKLIMKQILEALAYIHSLGLIHCDVKPENIVVKSYSRCEVKLIDFGSSCFTTDNLTTYIQSRSYRAPEVIIGHPYDGRIDIWSMGAVLAELHTGYVLFQNDSVPTMLARIAGVLGPIPHPVLMNGKETYKYYTSSCVVYEKAEEQSVSLVYPKHTTLEARLHFEKSSMTPDEVLFIDFTRKLLDLDPLQRPTAEEALTHAWFHDIDQLTIPPPKLTHPAATTTTATV